MQDVENSCNNGNSEVNIPDNNGEGGEGRVNHEHLNLQRWLNIFEVDNT